MGQSSLSSTVAETESLSATQWLWSLKPWQGVGDFGLEGIKAACKLFEDPQDAFRSLHVAGTNGKGSVVSYLSTSLSLAGYRVGSFTSPHLHRVNERIALNGNLIPDEDLEAILSQIKERSLKAKLALSFFETITLASFIYFRDQEVDFGVIEVGLGGRLDGTNVISSPEACIISSIGLDHERILGDSEAKIAAEKAGIIKKGSPVFVGEVSEEAFQVIEEKASSLNCSCHRFGRDFVLTIGGSSAEVECEGRRVTLAPRLPGRHQIKNAALSAAVLTSLGIGKRNIESGIQRTEWRGRLERIKVDHTEFLLDCAHNLQGVEALAEYLRQENLSGIPIVAGFLGTKRWPQMVDIISEFTSRFFLLRPNSNQAEDLAEIAKYLASKGKLSSVHDDRYEECIDLLLRAENQVDQVLVMGSMYLVSEIRELLIKKSQ